MSDSQKAWKKSSKQCQQNVRSVGNQLLKSVLAAKMNGTLVVVCFFDGHLCRYCERECQLKAWKVHKPMCDLIHEDLTNRK